VYNVPLAKYYVYIDRFLLYLLYFFQPMLLLQVELPKDERTVVRVSPSITMPTLLSYICEKRNLPVASHAFDLPATEESLANKTLKELKINTIKVLNKGLNHTHTLSHVLYMYMYIHVYIYTSGHVHLLCVFGL